MLGLKEPQGGRAIALLTKKRGQRKARRESRIRMFHTLAVASELPVSSDCPFGEKSTEVTSPLCPLVPMSSAFRQLSAACGVPDLRGPTFTGRDNSVTVWRNGHTANPGAVPKRDKRAAARYVPDLRCHILTSGDDLLAIPGKCHGPHSIFVSHNRPQRQAGLPLPKMPFESSLRGMPGLC